MGRRKKGHTTQTPQLDLHGVKHAEAEVMVEDYVLRNTPPLKIITGHSNAMKAIVKKVLIKHKYKFQDGDFFNLGCILVLS